VPDPAGRLTPTRRQVGGATAFKRGEGIWDDDGSVYVATTGDSRVHAYDISRQRFRNVYDGLASPDAPLLRVDALTANRAGKVFVCEDLNADEIDIGVIDPRVAGLAVPLGHGQGARGLGADGCHLRPHGWPHVLLLAARRRHRRRRRARPGDDLEVSGSFRGRV
jgi:hypothetical protein